MDVSQSLTLAQTRQALRAAEEADDHDEVVRAAGDLLILEPNDPDALFAMGVAHYNSRRPRAASAFFQRTLEIQPRHPAAGLLAVRTLNQAGRHKEAMAILNRRGVRLGDNTALLKHRGRTLYGLGHYALAARAYGRAIARRPEAELRYLRSLALLGMTRWKAGFAQLEARLELPVFQQYCLPDTPMWKKQTLRGKRLVVTWEQGLGDTLQFLRFVPKLPLDECEIIVRCQPELVDLLNRLPYVSQAVTGMPDSDFQISLLSLPHRLNVVSWADIPADPYIPPSPSNARLRRWCKGVAHLKVGLVASSRGSGGYPGPDETYRQLKSVPFARFYELSGVEGVSTISLDPNVTQRQVSAMGAVVPGPEIRSFADTADLVSGLDLVVTVDTAVAHLAGAMGKPVWVLLAGTADWRWPWQEATTPWYPSMSLFRQSTVGHWGDVIQSVRERLQRVVAGEERL